MWNLGNTTGRKREKMDTGTDRQGECDTVCDMRAKCDMRQE